MRSSMRDEENDFAFGREWRKRRQRNKAAILSNAESQPRIALKESRRRIRALLVHSESVDLMIGLSMFSVRVDIYICVCCVRVLLADDRG